MAAVRLWTGTTEGIYVMESGPRRDRWTRRGPYLKGTSISHFAWDAPTRTLYAATLDEGVFATRTTGRSWTPLNRGLPVRRVWTLAVHPKDSDTLYAGTHFSYLFRSTDRGRSWMLMPGYLKAPGHEGRYGDWGFGTVGNCLHTILIDPRQPARIYVASSTDAGNTGTQRSDDAGETWQPIRDGTYESCPDSAAYDGHLPNEHTCTHRLAYAPSQPKTLYRQMHCGVYRSEDFGATWRDISAGLASRHGFPLAVHPRRRDTLYVIPAYQGKCKRHNSCIQGQLEVYRSRTSGRRWEPLRVGLPADVHCVVLRHGLGSDALDPTGLYFGTTTGEVYGSADEGDSWRSIARGLPRVQGVLAVA